MKRALLLGILLIVSVAFVNAQVTISPDFIQLSAESVGEIYDDIEIENNGTEDIELFWQFATAEDFPAEWRFQICDLNLCYNWDIGQSGTFMGNTVPAGEKVKFTIKVQHVDSDVSNLIPISGSSFGVLKLFDNNDFVDPVSISSDGTVSTTNLNLEEIVLFPNPTTNMFQVKNDVNVASISIYNIVGRQISTTAHSSGMIHDVSDLRPGMYLIRLENNKGDIVKSMRLSKR